MEVWPLLSVFCWKRNNIFDAHFPLEFDIHNTNAMGVNTVTPWPRVLATFEQRNHYTNVANTFGQAYVDKQDFFLFTYRLDRWVHLNQGLGQLEVLGLWLPWLVSPLVLPHSLQAHPHPPVVSMLAMSVPPPPVITMASLPVNSQSFINSVSSVQCISSTFKTSVGNERNPFWPVK